MATTSTPTLSTEFLVSRTTTLTGTPSCTNGTPNKYGHVDDPSACNAYYAYNPSFAAAILFSVLFGLLLITHIIQAFYFKKRFTWVIIMGALWEVGSFAARTASTRNQQSLGLIIMSQLLFLLSPLWINAFVYMTLGRLVYFFHPRRRCFGIKAESIAKYFVWADIVSFIVQGAGGSMISPENGPKTMKIGTNIYMGGMGLQEAFIVIFTALGIKFQVDMKNFEARGEAHPGRRGWKLQMYILYVTLALITMRIIFRLVEFTRGTDVDNPFLKHEQYIYVLDAMPMFFAILLLSVFHSGRVLKGPDSEFLRLSRKEKKELKRKRKAEKKQRKYEKKFGKIPIEDEELGVKRQ